MSIKQNIILLYDLTDPLLQTGTFKGNNSLGFGAAKQNV